MAGGLSTNAFDELKYTEFHENIYFVGAYKKIYYYMLIFVNCPHLFLYQIHQNST